MYDYLIVGAGLFGSTFAHEMTKLGKKCLVIDRRQHIGGNIYCEKVNGINVHKYGAHIFHTSNKKIWEYVNQFAEFNNYVNSPIANYHGELYNTGYYLLNKPCGSYCYRGRWQTLDHIIVSGGMLNGKSEVQAVSRMSVYAAPFLLEQAARGTNVRPKPTYRGPRYIGGTSDHLPVSIAVK